MTKPASFDARLDLVPHSPGVYLMKDKAGEVIYVGKAIDLRQRLSSYFNGGSQEHVKVAAMLEHLHDFSYLVCNNELEAFILESNLIKRYQPFYNILLKDDHDYPYIHVTVQEDYPRVLKAYRIGPDQEEGARYYGPFLNGDINQALRTIHEIFPLKTCRRVFPRDIGKERPCLRYDMGQCIGPCTGDVTPEEYRAVVSEVCDYLEGRYDELLKHFEEAMEDAAAQLDFEAAAKHRDRKRSLERLQSRQIAVLDRSWDGDALGMAENQLEFAILKLEVRQGKISGTSTHFIKQDGSSAEDVLMAYITQYYLTAVTVPDEILLDRELPEGQIAALEDYLTELRRSKKGRWAALQAKTQESNLVELLPRRAHVSQMPARTGEAEAMLQSALAEFEDVVEAYGGADETDELASDPSEGVQLGQKAEDGPRRVRRVHLRVPQRGEKAQVVQMAVRNAKGALQRRVLMAGTSPESLDLALKVLAEYLGLERLPRRIEAYDVANLGSEAMNCGMVVFEDGKVKRNQGRNFNIKRVEGQDDYQAMEEAVQRRLKRWDDQDFAKRPDLILVDGGIGHVNRIRRVLDEEGRHDLPVAGMVKDQRHRTRGLVLQNGETLELAAELGLLRGESSQTGDAPGGSEGLGKALIEDVTNRMLLLVEDGEKAASSAEIERRHEMMAVLRLLTAIQNEVHRKANSQHQTLRRKKTFRYRLEEIPGVGPARRQKLMESFDTIKAISEASKEEILERVPSLGDTVARNVYLHFHPEEAKDDEGLNILKK